MGAGFVDMAFEGLGEGVDVLGAAEPKKLNTPAEAAGLGATGADAVGATGAGAGAGAGLEDAGALLCVERPLGLEGGDLTSDA